MRTDGMRRGIVCLAGCAALAFGPCGPGGSTTQQGSGDGDAPSPTGPRPTGFEPVPPVVLECRNGPEPSWQVSLGSVPGLNACMGSLLFDLGAVTIETGVPGPAISALAGAPTTPELPKECGPGCALAMEETLVYLPDQGLVTIFKGHKQTRFGWSSRVNGWVPQPYLYVDLLGYTLVDGKPSPVTEATSAHAFADVAIWVVRDRDGGTSVYEKSGGVYRIAERNDALAAMDKEASTTAPTPMFVRGRTIEYVRGTPGDYLTEIRDFRHKDGVTAVVIQRQLGDPSTNPEFGRIEAVAYEAITDDGAIKAQAWARYGYDASGRLSSVQLDANDPTGQVFRQPTLLEYDAADGARVSKVTDAAGAVTQYAYQGGRVQQILHPARTASEDESLTFEYLCGGTWCPMGAVPAQFSETDDDGFLRLTRFAPFPDGTPLAWYAAEVATGTRIGGVPRIDPSSVKRTSRDATGTLRVRHHVADGIVETWNTDGHPADACAAHRVDRDVSPDDRAFLDAAFGGYVPSRSVSDVDYEVRCYDRDNMLVRTQSPAGREEVTYHKDEHDPAWHREFGWAAQLPSRTVSAGRDANDHADSAGSETRVEAFSAGSSCLAEVGASVPALPDASFVVCGTSTASGGNLEVAILDRWLRPVASSTPQDIDFKILSYDKFGNTQVASDPSAAELVERKFSPTGDLVDEKVSVCGSVVTHRTHGAHATLETTSETIGGTVTTVTNLTLSAASGRVDKSEMITPGYTRTQEYRYTPTGDVATGHTISHAQTLPPGATEAPEEYSREEWEWTVRGHR